MDRVREQIEEERKSLDERQLVRFASSVENWKRREGPAPADASNEREAEQHPAIGNESSGEVRRLRGEVQGARTEFATKGKAVGAATRGA